MNLPCERVAKKRGRKRKQDIDSDLAETNLISSTTSNGDQKENQYKRMGDIAVPHVTQPQAPAMVAPSNYFAIPDHSQPLALVQPSIQPNTLASFNPPPQHSIVPPVVQFTSPPLASPASTSNSLAQVGEVPTDPSGNATSIFQGFTSKGHSLAEGLDLVSAAAGHVSLLENALANSFQDPIACGIVSDAEADQLVRYYFAHLQDCICLLDPDLHTAVYMRENTLILLTAVLAVAAKFTREKHLYDRLFAMADSAIKTAIFQPLYELQVIQAICILVCR